MVGMTESTVEMVDFGGWEEGNNLLARRLCGELDLKHISRKFRHSAQSHLNTPSYNHNTNAPYR